MPLFIPRITADNNIGGPINIITIARVPSPVSVMSLNKPYINKNRNSGINPFIFNSEKGFLVIIINAANKRMNPSMSILFIPIFRHTLWPMKRKRNKVKDRTLFIGDWF